MAVILPAAPRPLQADEPVAHVLSLSGAVNILREGSAQGASPASPLLRDDQVVTGADSRAQIQFTDGSLVTLGESTVLAIAAFSPPRSRGPGSAALDLVTGIVRLVTGGPYDAFEVRTRSAIASARGTRWIVESAPERESVFVIEGRVAVRGRRTPGIVQIAAGEGTDVLGGGAPQPPAAWGEARVRDVLARTSAP